MSLVKLCTVKELFENKHAGYVKCYNECCQKIAYFTKKEIQKNGYFSVYLCENCPKLIKDKEKKIRIVKNNPIKKNINRSKDDNIKRILHARILHFCGGADYRTFDVDEFLLKIGENPICYITKTPINLEDTTSYHLDHIIPASKGGSNDLDNCQICLAKINCAKSNMFLNEFLDLCKLVINNTKNYPF